MRRFDKNKNMVKANLLVEQRYLESKGFNTNDAISTKKTITENGGEVNLTEYGKLYSNGEFLGNSPRTTGEIKVGKVYDYTLQIEGLPVIKVKVEEILNENYFMGIIVEENEGTEYKNMKKGGKYQFPVSQLIAFG